MFNPFSFELLSHNRILTLLTFNEKKYIYILFDKSNFC